MDMLMGGLLLGFLLGMVAMAALGLAEWERGYRRGRREREARSSGGLPTRVRPVARWTTR